MQRFFFGLSLLCLWPALVGLAIPPTNEDSSASTTASTNASSNASNVHEEWLGIYQDEQKVGYLQRRLLPTKLGYDWEEHWWLSLNLSHEVRTTHTTVRAHADRSCTLSSFSLWSVGAGTALYINAAVTNRNTLNQKIRGESISDGAATSFTVPLSLPLQLPPLCQMAAPIASRPGSYREFSVFNPLSLRTEVVSLTTVGAEMIDFNGHLQRATKLVSEVNDSPLYVWLDLEGRTLKEEIAPGVVLRRESHESAQSGNWQEQGFTTPISTADIFDTCEGK